MPNQTMIIRRSSRQQAAHIACLVPMNTVQVQQFDRNDGRSFSPCALARYISPRISSGTGQGSSSRSRRLWQHREASETVVPMVTIRCAALK